MQIPMAGDRLRGLSVSTNYLEAIDNINKAACANGALAHAIERGDVIALTASRRHIQDIAPKRTRKGRNLTGDTWRKATTKHESPLAG